MDYLANFGFSNQPEDNRVAIGICGAVTEARTYFSDIKYLIFTYESDDYMGNEVTEEDFYEILKKLTKGANREIKRALDTVSHYY